jgi:hypothetical protein
LAWQELADWIVGEAVARNEQEKKAGPFRTPNPGASLPKKNAGTLNLTTNLERQNLARRFFLSLLVGSAMLESAIAKANAGDDPQSHPLPPNPNPQSERSERMKQSTTLARALISLSEAEARDRGWDGSEGVVIHFQLVGTPDSVDVTLGKIPEQEERKPQKESA